MEKVMPKLTEQQLKKIDEQTALDMEGYVYTRKTPIPDDAYNTLMGSLRRLKEIALNYGNDDAPAD
jgi:hypothetical protein